MTYIQNFNEFIAAGGQTLLTEAGKASGYSDEHAFVNTWNHAVNHGIAQDKDKMHDEIEAAKKDKNHPLNFHKVSAEGFKGKDKSKSTPEQYYNELHHAAKTIHTVANHPDFKGAVEHKHQASVAGASRGSVSDSWKSHGATNSTSKADIKIGTEHALSYKKSGGSQLMSAEPAETKATYHHAINGMRAEGKLTDEQRDKLHDHVEKASAALAKMKEAGADKTALKNEAQHHIDAVHAEHPELINYVHHEAASGHHKFGGGEGSATHILSSYNEKTDSAGLHHVNEYKHGTMKTAHPRAALPKGDGRYGNLKIDIRD